VCLPSGSWIDAVKIELESAGDSGGFGQRRKVRSVPRVVFPDPGGPKRRYLEVRFIPQLYGAESYPRLWGIP
jgi:hypothetical protein